jgi:hypothetical protein
VGQIDTDWFDPVRLFEAGYPAGLTSALRVLPHIRAELKAELLAMRPTRVLEVGPGDAPIAVDLDPSIRVVFLDIAPYFLSRLGGARVRADVMAPPFAPGAFDVVLAGDVMTHLRPAARRPAVRQLASLCRAILLFNPEPGTQQVPESPSPTHPIADTLAQEGWQVVQRKFVAVTPGGEYVMRLVRGVR